MHSENASITSKLRFILYAEKIKRGIDFIVQMQAQFFYFKISVTK